MHPFKEEIQMTARERCLNILHYRSADRMPAVHFGYWPELLQEWAETKEIMDKLLITEV